MVRPRWWSEGVNEWPVSATNGHQRWASIQHDLLNKCLLAAGTSGRYVTFVQMEIWWYTCKSIIVVWLCHMNPILTAKASWVSYGVMYEYTCIYTKAYMSDRGCVWAAWPTKSFYIWTSEYDGLLPVRPLVCCSCLENVLWHGKGITNCIFFL